MRAADLQSKNVSQSCIPVHSKPAVQALTEIKGPCSIDDLISLVRADEEKIFAHARKLAIDPLTLRCKLLLHLPRLVTGDALPGEHAIQREILAVSDLIEESQRPYTQWLKQPEGPVT